ncbi:hypothetical protein HK102_014176 [Quaeritorhiza haematococci]|nr:hypothetical protein HK102_014176 [Quaeritorhiza haematococci]
MLEPVRLCHVRSIVLDFAHNLHHIAYPSADIVANLLSCLHQPAELHTCIIYLPWHISGDDSLFSVLSSRFTCVKHLSIQGIGSREVLTGIEGKSLRRIVKTWPDGQLTHLALIGHGMGTFSAKTFMKLLEKNKSIKSLGFGYMRGTVDLDGIGKLLPQLESLSITFEYRSSANDTVGGDDEEVFEAYAYANFNRARGTGLRRSLHQYSEEILPELKGGLTQFHKLTSLTLQGASPLLPVPLEPITNVLVTLPGFKERLDELTRSAFSKQPSRTAPDPIPICNLSTLRLLNIHPSPSATSIPLVRVNTPAYLGLMTVFSDLPHLKSLSLPVVLCRTEVLVGLGASGCALENVAVHGEVEDSSGEEDDDGEREVSPLLRFKKIWPAMVVERF